MTDNSKKRIVIATPLFPPEVGGPSFYADMLAHVLTDETYKVSVVSYGWLKKTSNRSTSCCICTETNTVCSAR